MEGFIPTAFMNAHKCAHTVHFPADVCFSITFSETSLNFNKIGKSNFAQSLNHEIEKMISKKLIDYNWEYKRYKKQRGIQRDPYK